MPDGTSSLHGPLHPRHALQRIQLRWNEGSVTWRGHLERELANDKLEMTDVEHLVRRGRVTEWSRPGAHWRYKIEGLVLDGRRAACVVEVNGTLVLITAFIVKPRLTGR